MTTKLDKNPDSLSGSSSRENNPDKVISDAERNANTSDGQSSNTLENENLPENQSDDTVGSGYTGDKNTSSGLSRIFTKKRVGIGGGATGLAAVLATIMIGSSSLYLVHIKENLTGQSNRVNSAISLGMQKRRLNTFGKIIQRKAQDLKSEKLITKLNAEGFEVVYSGGAIQKISKNFGDDVVELVFEGSNNSLAKQVAILGESSAGKEFIKSFDNVAKEGISRFAGVVSRKKVYQRLGIYALIDWIGAVRTKVGTSEFDLKNPRAALSESITQSDEAIREFTSNLTDRAAIEAIGLDPDNLDPGDSFYNLGDEVAENADALKKEVRESGGERVVLAAEEQTAKITGEVAEDATKALAGEKVTKEVAQDVAKKVGGKFGSTLLTGLASGFDPTTIIREGCRAKGTLQFVKNIRNTLMAIELAKFALKFYTIADHQKAGLVQSSSVKLMALYLAGSTGSGGMQWALNAGKASVSAEGLSKYGVGYADVGILSAVSTFLGAVPLLDAKSCKIVNNTFTQIGATLVGGVVAAVTFGSSATVVSGLSIGASVGLTVANEIMFAVGTPLLLRTASSLVVDGWENYLQAGDALASGDGAFKNQTGGANGGLPVSNDLFAIQSLESDSIYKDSLAKTGVFNRYFDLAKSDSLLSKVATFMPFNLKQLSYGIRDYATGYQNQTFNVVSSMFNNFGGNKAYAAGSTQCTDEAAIEYDIATDPFCNPIMSYVPLLDIDQTEEVLKTQDTPLIDGGGQPVGEFADFVENCFSGRSGILHPPEISTDGNTPDNDDTCVVGKGDDPILAGDVPEYFAAVNIPDNRSWVQKIISPSAYAQTPSNERTPTKKERFAAWYGYLVDQQTLTSQINNDLVDIGFEEPQLVNSNVFVLGDSLTVGMQNLAGTDTGGGNYLQRELNSKGWTATIDAQGCRSVYQANGAISGDGTGCPNETIIDGISAVKNISNTEAVRSAGTFIVALGTNGGESGASDAGSTQIFKEKSIELIDEIKKINPSANVYWLNLHFRQETAREIERNQVINELVSEKGIRLMDWDTYVNTINSNTDYGDDITFASYPDGTKDNVHHTASGYQKKTEFLVNALGAPSSNINDTTIVTGQSTENIPCGAGADRGVVDGYEKGVLTKIRICDVQGTIVNSQIASNIDKMYTEAKAAGAPLGGSGFRTMEAQRSGWTQRCGSGYPETSRWQSPPCTGAQLARPGYSNHQMGFAIDLTCGSPQVIGSVTNPCFVWLENNAYRFGMYEWGNDEQLPVSPSRGKGGYEPWHWSVNGN